MNDFRLFAHGKSFDVDAYLSSCTLRPDGVWRRGEKRDSPADRIFPETSGVEYRLSDGVAVPFLEQRGIAIAYLKAHREELRALAQTPGVDTFILGFQYDIDFDDNIAGFCLGPSPRLMWHCLDVGCVPTYYVNIVREGDPALDD